MRIFAEREHVCDSRSQDRLSFGRSTVPESDPEDLWWCAAQEASLAEVIILCHDDEALVCGMTPDRLVVARRKPGVTHVRRVGIEIREPWSEAR